MYCATDESVRILRAVRVILGARRLWVVRPGAPAWVEEKGTGSQWSVIEDEHTPTGFKFV